MTRNGTKTKADTATAEDRGREPTFVGELARAAMIIAMRGAGEYLRVHKLNVDPEALRLCVKDRCKAKMDEALSDAKEAFDISMTEVGVQTFTATMVQAGIEGAKMATENPIEVTIIRATEVANKEGTQMIVIDDRLADRDDLCYGGRCLSFNKLRLGNRFFDIATNQVGIDDLLIHEFAHEYSGDHLSADYYQALTRIGAKAIAAARERRI